MRRAFVPILLSLQVACTPTAEDAETALQKGDLARAISVAEKVIQAGNDGVPHAKKVADEARLRRVLKANTIDEVVAMWNTGFFSDHHKEIAHLHIVDVIKYKVGAHLDKKKIQLARRDYDKTKRVLADLSHLEIRLLVAELEHCHINNKAQCIQDDLDRLQKLAPTEATKKTKQLKEDTWHEEVVAWRDAKNAKSLQERREACKELSAAAYLNQLLDKEAHRKAHEQHLKHCQRVERRALAREARQQQRTPRSHKSVRNKKQATHYGSSPHCTKGCRCGNACISCQKTCRH